MDLAIIVLGILYLCGVKVGTPLAICAIIEGLLIIISAIIKKLNEQGLTNKPYCVIIDLSKERN